MQAKKKAAPKAPAKARGRSVPADRGTGSAKAAAHKGSAAQGRKNPSNGRKTAIMGDGTVGTVTTRNGRPVEYSRTSPSNTGKMRTKRYKLPLG